jgi:UDP-3-O-[3-hydroxymyristoyl] glucosamine N-acyltransferase
MPEKRTTAPLRLDEVARLVSGTVIGDGAVPIHRLCPLNQPEGGALTMYTGSSATRLSRELAALPPMAVLVSAKKFTTEALAGARPATVQLLAVKEPMEALLILMPHFFEAPAAPAGVSERAEIHPTAKIGKGVRIGPFCVIGDEVELGDEVVLHPHVVLYPRAKIGPRTVIHSGATVREECIIGADLVIQNGAVIGSDGFGYHPDPALGLRPVPQIGIVRMGDRVDIGANSCIDRGTLGATILGLGVKVDNLVQIGHNVRIGEHSILCGQVAIAGSVTLGKGVVLGGNVGIADHVSIGDGARLAAKAGAFTDLDGKQDYGGHPAVPLHDWRRQRAALARLPKLLRKLEGAAPPSGETEESE